MLHARVNLELCICVPAHATNTDEENTKTIEKKFSKVQASKGSTDTTQMISLQSLNTIKSLNSIIVDEYNFLWQCYITTHVKCIQYHVEVFTSTQTYN